MADAVTAARLAALAVLGLPERASARDATRAYHRLARETHPDLAGSAEEDAAGRFATLADAYHTLLADERAGSAARGAVPRPRPRPTPEPARAAAPTPVAVHVREDPPRTAPVRVRLETTRPPIVAGPVRITSLPHRPRSSPWRGPVPEVAAQP